MSQEKRSVKRMKLVDGVPQKSGEVVYTIRRGRGRQYVLKIDTRKKER